MTRLSFYNSTAAGRIYPVHANSTRNEVKFRPLAKRQAARLYHDARRFERRTRIARHQDGKLGRNGLAILQAMLFDCINYISGRLDPSYETIARLANISVRSVARGLVKLKSAGVLDWVRRCHWNDDGTLEQDSNAYRVLEAGSWKGYTPPAPIPPTPEHWGAPDKVPTPLELGVQKILEGDAIGATRALELEPPPDGLEGALVRATMRRAKNGGSQK